MPNGIINSQNWLFKIPDKKKKNILKNTIQLIENKGCMLQWDSTWDYFCIFRTFVTFWVLRKVKFGYC